MRKTFLALFLIVCMCLLASCKQEPPVSHEITTVCISKADGSHHSYCFRYYSPAYGAYVTSYPAPDPEGYSWDWFKFPMNYEIRAEVDGIDKGSFTVTEPYQAIYL